MSELLQSMSRQACYNNKFISLEQEFTRGNRRDSGWGAYDTGVQRYNQDLAFVLDYQPIQGFIHTYCDENNLNTCSIADYLGTGVVRNLKRTHGVSFSYAHELNLPGEYIDGNIFHTHPWKQGQEWLQTAYDQGRIESPYFDISISRALAGISGMIQEPEPYGILLRRAYRLMHPTRGVLLFQAFLPTQQYEPVLSSWKESLKQHAIELTYTATAIRLDRHEGSPKNLPMPG